MSSSGTYAFAPDNADLIDEAFERILIDPATLVARHFKSAAMSMNLLFAYWETKGIKLFQVDEQTQALTVSDPDFTAASGTLAILEGVIRRDGMDTPVHRITREQYHLIPDKTAEGLPTQVWFNRATLLATLWQVPENSTDVFRYMRLRRIQDAGTGVNTPDLPIWWFEALASGLAAFLAEKFAPQLHSAKMALADQRLEMALSEDRERVDTSFSMARI